MRADLTLRDASGATALHAAALMGHMAVEAWIVKEVHQSLFLLFFLFTDVYGVCCGRCFGLVSCMNSFRMFVCLVWFGLVCLFICLSACFVVLAY